MANTVFYSWQSDCPNDTNRTFIEDAIEKAIKEVSTDISIQIAERNRPLELDKDTKGVPGIPPIADVIFQKISGATVFVPDLTFVGKTEENRLIPNPNVLIEYGWALRSLGHSRIIPIMNTAYGNLTQENLPFNMRHLRHPLTYHLSNKAELDEKIRVRAALVKQFVQAITLILRSHPPEATWDALGHIAIPFTEDPSTFLRKDESLGVIDDGIPEEIQLVVPDNEHLFLRVLPQNPTQKIDSTQKVLQLLKASQIMPMPLTSQAHSWVRNKHGAFTVYHDKKKVLSLIQVFQNRELWGIDTSRIDKNTHKKRSNVDFGYFPCASLEIYFIQTLSTCLPFCKDILELPLPLKFIVGATKVEGYKMAVPNDMHFNGKFDGKVFNEHIVYEGTITGYDIVPKVILRPFFEKIWEECGLQRPDREQL
ncbi:hypothetical protein [Nitrospira sp. Ecomares 2.1]